MLTKNALDAICVALQHGDDKELVVTPRYIRELVGTSCHISPRLGFKKKRKLPAVRLLRECVKVSVLHHGNSRDLPEHLSRESQESETLCRVRHGC